MPECWYDAVRREAAHSSPCFAGFPASSVSPGVCKIRFLLRDRGTPGFVTYYDRGIILGPTEEGDA